MQSVLQIKNIGYILGKICQDAHNVFFAHFLQIQLLVMAAAV